MAVVFPDLSPEEEALAVKDTEKKAAASVKEGDHVYLISSTWFKLWMAYTGFKVDGHRMTIAPPAEPCPRPGPLDSNDLVSQEARPDSDFSVVERAKVVNLSANKLEHRDFRVISEPTFRFLVERYVLRGPAVEREYMQLSVAGTTEIDMQQLHFKVLVEDDPEKAVILAASDRMTMRNLKRRACKAAEVDEGEYMLFDYKGMKLGKQLDDLSPSKMVSSAGLTDQQALQLRPRSKVQEERAEEGPVPPPGLPAPIALPAASASPHRMLSSSPMVLGSSLGSPTSPLSRSISNPPPFVDEDCAVPDPNAPRGLAGLGNLGNTCFMNSALQCLAHTPVLLHMFLSERYKQDLNAENPMGLGGKLAESFATLLVKLWAGGVAYVKPTMFKWRLSRFAPQFKGYNQQDSQELLAFLLDGLHEDLNRVRDKPYIELKDSGERSDEDLAAEALSVYKARNNSIIASSFTGLYRSLLTCPECDFQSRTMEPIMYLSLPLPASKMRTISLTVVHVNGSKGPAQYAVTVPKSATVGDVVNAVAKAVGNAGQGHEQRILLAETSYRLETFRDMAAPVSMIKEPSSGFRFSSSPRLLAYIYDESWEGKREVQVTHKSSSYLGMNLPTSILFLPVVELEGLQAGLAKEGFDWQLAPGSSLEARIDLLLRPCQRSPSVAPVAATATGSDGASAAGAEKSATRNAVNMADADAATSLMDLDPVADDASAADPTPVSADTDSSKPFDMFAQQEQQQAAAGAMTGADGAPPFKLKFSGYSSTVPVLKDVAEPITFTAEWDSARLGALYDKSAWESPAADASELEARKQQRSPAKVTLADCLRSFLEPERLDSDNSWYCSRCKEFVQADKKLDMWSLPDVLMVHLKRFSNLRYTRDKLDTPVEFPLEGLDMGPYLLPRAGGSSSKAAVPPGAAVYDCFAVSNHFGGLGGGHYTAYAKLPGGNGQWYCFDDSHVSRVEPQTVLSPAAYVLFYQRRGGGVDGLPPPSAMASTCEAVGGSAAADLEPAAAELQQPATDDSELVAGGEMELS